MTPLTRCVNESASYVPPAAPGGGARARAMRTNTRSRDPARRSQPSRSHRSGRARSDTTLETKTREVAVAGSQSVAASRSYAQRAPVGQFAARLGGERTCVSYLSGVRFRYSPARTSRSTQITHGYITTRIRDPSRLSVLSR